MEGVKAMSKTIAEVIAQTQAVRPDIYSDTQMTEWLSALDGQLSLELLHAETPVQYSWPEDANTQLLVPHPYDRLYHLYMIAMIDLYNRETDLYSNDMGLFNAALQEYRAYYRRTNRPDADGNWFKTM